MKELSYIEKMNLPHSAFFDPPTQRVAAYTANHRLITANSTPQLVQYTQDPKWEKVAFDKEKHAHGQPIWRPLPDWATPEVQARMLLVRFRPNGVQSEQEWAEIPRA